MKHLHSDDNANPQAERQDTSSLEKGAREALRRLARALGRQAAHDFIDSATETPTQKFEIVASDLDRGGS